MAYNTNKKIRAFLPVLILVGSAGITLCGLMALNANPTQPQTTKQEQVATTVMSVGSHIYGLPVRLAIPKINVDTNILPMGITSLGNMEAPKTNEDAGWYKYGPHPGNKGSAVIAGHLGVRSVAVFSQLSVLVKGDKVSVTDDRGKVASFEVTDTREYDYDTEPKEVFSSSSGIHLNLITCNGDWDSELKTYSKRLVVFTDKL